MKDRIRPVQWRNATSALGSQCRALWPVMLLIYTPVVIIFAIVIAIRVQTGIAIAMFTRDPLGFTDIPVYKGVVSHLGVLIWAGAAAVCLFSYGVIRRWSAGGVSSHFLLAGGLITALLFLDDLFMLHEVVFPVHLGIAQDIVYGTHVILLLWFLVWYRATILQTNFLLLALAFVGFGVSVGVDLTASLYSVPGLYIFEDGGKLIGIVSWTAYFTLVSAWHVTSGEYQDANGTADSVHARVVAGSAQAPHAERGT